MKPRRIWPVTLAALPLLLACAAGAGGSRQPSTVPVRLEVRNDLLPRQGITVRVVSSAGARSLLGAVSPGQTAVLEYEQPSFQGLYYFLAEADGGPTIRSRTVVLAGRSGLVWTLKTNTLQEQD